MNWYRIASTAAVVFLIVALLCALFHPDVDVLFGLMLMAPFAMVGWVVSVLNHSEESSGDFSKGEWYENF